MFKKFAVITVLFGLICGFHNTSTVKAVEVGCYKTFELVFNQSTSTPSNPFDTYALKLEVTDPVGHKFEIDGFYDGDGKGGQAGNIWKARIAPYQTGTWSWRTVQGDIADEGLSGISGQFTVNDANDHGGIVADGRYFKFQDGTPIYLAGNFLDFTPSIFGGSSHVNSTHVYMSEALNDAGRNAIMQRQRDFHDANKANIYIANKNDYSNYGSRSVTPWVGTAGSNDKDRMDLSRWQQYDGYISDFKNNQMLAELWFFADDSNFGSLPLDDQQRLIRYSMARTSAFSHASYVLALEWQEGFSSTRINQLGTYAQQYNPWERMLSVHSTTNSNWAFAGQDWPTFIATQSGNSAVASGVNAYGLTIRSQDTIPHVDEEYGILKLDSDGRLRHNLWANLASGAAGGGTGSDLNVLQRFMEQSDMPFQRMAPNNGLVTSGGNQSFALAETGHHYMVFSVLESFSVNLSGTNLQARWFNPRDPGASLGAPFAVSAGSKQFIPPAPQFGNDWILWITDGTNLNAGVTHPTGDAVLLQMPALPGDFNGDGAVDVSDLGILATNYRVTSGMGIEDGDTNGDGAVDVSDLGILATNYGTTTSIAVPEPSSLSLLAGIMLVGLLRRKYN